MVTWPYGINLAISYALAVRSAIFSAIRNQAGGSRWWVQSGEGGLIGYDNDVDGSHKGEIAEIINPSLLPAITRPLFLTSPHRLPPTSNLSIVHSFTLHIPTPQLALDHVQTIPPTLDSIRPPFTPRSTALGSIRLVFFPQAILKQPHSTPRYRRYSHRWSSLFLHPIDTR